MTEGVECCVVGNVDTFVVGSGTVIFTVVVPELLVKQAAAIAAEVATVDAEAVEEALGEAEPFVLLCSFTNQ